MICTAISLLCLVGENHRPNKYQPRSTVAHRNQINSGRRSNPLSLAGCPMESCNLGSSTLVSSPHAPPPHVRALVHLPSSRINLPGWKRTAKQRPLTVSRARGSLHDEDPGNGLSAATVPSFQEAIGAEYGEGFETFRMDGPLKMDVDFLNDKLQECFLQRIRHAMKPDEAFGLIFSWDNVVADTRSLKLDAWKQLTIEEGRDMPTESHVQRTMLYATVDYVLQKVLFWGGEVELERLKSRFLQLYHENLLKLSEPMEGLKEWLDALSKAGIPCALVSCLGRKIMLESLERMELQKYFQVVVTEEDGMESMAHRFLSAAVKLDRKPSKCVVFEDDPRGITAAHNCTMMAVALIGAHPAYELVQADLAVSNFSELSVINLRRLFAHSGSHFMDLQKQVVERTPLKRKLTISSDSISS